MSSQNGPADLGKPATHPQPRSSEGRIKTLWVRESYLSQILAGRKTVEVRVGYDNIRRLQPGDRLMLNDQHLVTIRRIGRYADFEEMLAHEDALAIAPDLPPDELLAALRKLYPSEKEALGAVALEVESPPLSRPHKQGRGQDGRYDVVLFDMGYTLIYFEPPQETIAQQSLRAAGAERSVDEIMAAVKVVWGEYYRDAVTVTFPATPEYDREAQARLETDLLAHLGLGTDPATLQTYTNAIEAGFSRPGVIRPYPEVLDVLSSLREQGFRLGIVSNWSWNLRDRVAQTGLDGFFEMVWASAYAGCNKPHPGIFYQALVQMDVPAERALYVGDSYPHDVVGARNAGIDVALLDREGKAEDADCPVIGDLWGVFQLLGARR
jgi:FMN phosphatase YigB (HAD superfamily)/ASC-1-like (ASCH) protein